MSDTDRQPDAALDRLIDVHRGWCNYCKGNVKACDEAPPSGCSLRDYLVALLSSPSAPSRDNAVLEEALNCYSPDDSAADWADKIRAIKTAPQGHESGGACSKTPHPSHDPAAAAPHPISDELRAAMLGRDAAAPGDDDCVHDWKIWPETDGNEQRCMKCRAYRTTPEADKFWLRTGDDARDAARYRWLRECQSIPANILLNHHAGLDAAIDAAMQRTKWRSS